MEADYDVVLQLGRWFIGRWLPISRKRGLFLARINDNGCYMVKLNLFWWDTK